MIADKPENENQRLRILDGLKILDTEADESYDVITRLASTIMETPVALISLIDDERQWFKSKVGIEDEGTSRDVAFCAHAILHPHKETIVEDATKDKRFADNPYVLDGGVRFYFGIPLVIEDQPIGTICAIDIEPRKPTQNQINSLKELSKLVVIQLELRKSILDINDNVSKLNLTNDKNEEEYLALYSTCDNILKKIKARKSNQN